MKLSQTLADDFSSQTRGRGYSYFRSNAVRIAMGSDYEVKARVRGARDYQVEISYTAPDLNLWCDCPFFESTGPCKHLWATMLAAEAQGYLQEAGKLTSEQMYYDLPETPEDLYFEDEYPDEDEDDDEDDYVEPRRPVKRPPAPAPKPIVFKPPPPKAPAWREQLKQIAPLATSSETWPVERQLLYVVDVPGSNTHGALLLKLMTREPRKAGGWKKPQIPRMTRNTLSILPDEADRQILGMLTGVTSNYEWSGFYDSVPSGFKVLGPLAAVVLPRIAATGRCILQENIAGQDSPPLVWDDGEPWRFHLRLDKGNQRYAVSGWLRRGEEEMEITEPALLTEGWVFARNRVARLDETAPWLWIRSLRKMGRIEAPEEDAVELMQTVLEHREAPQLDIPAELQYEEVRITPRPCLAVRASVAVYEQQRLRGELSFDYDGWRIRDNMQARGVYDAAGRRFLPRNRDAEEAARNLLRQLGFTGPVQNWNDTEPVWRLSEKKLPAAARACVEAGWHIEAEGKTFRKPGNIRVEVSSGVDWFELHGVVEYGETSARLPALLAAVRRGDNMVRLDDGTYGLLPEEWLQKFGIVAGLGTSNRDHIRFRRNQVGVLDALLATQPDIGCDETFARARQELRRFEGIRAAEQPAGFVGQLRDYQREGLGWMEFLRRFGFGGCLADDMGVGKTAQVLAMLLGRKKGSEGEPSGPSLVVVPRSLVFNWKQEAARFTPDLRVLDHTGVTRRVDGFADYDIVLTTYGTLRRDALEFKDLEFDYIVLDEAQAIKNAGTESAKAVRLLRGRHRLALSGTPVENHLGELWSLFEFLNPGMLGAASVFKLAGSAGRNPNEETRAMLAHAVRPFFLRRTKQQVARELPQKTEQTIFCEMEAAERKRYDELRTHYRNSLLGRIDEQGLAKSKIMVLEALLRLRQAACHPGLLDVRRKSEPSAKLDMLLEHLREIAEEGHKALVFSQFTSLLAIVRERLDAEGIAYEYLDGATRDRQQRVEHFQGDPDCRLFLISLKAGGLGLNLTAAEYIFLLDPWWNPAVEAQAIDRAHRIGQTRRVFAYRLIARDTVEEKVLQLQQTKRDLASAIISEDNSLIRNLQREDLELLLS